MSAELPPSHAWCAAIEGPPVIVRVDLALVPVVSVLEGAANGPPASGGSFRLVPAAVIVCRPGGTEWVPIELCEPPIGQTPFTLADVAVGHVGPAPSRLALMLESDNARTAAVASTFVAPDGWSEEGLVQLHEAHASTEAGELTITTGRPMGALRVAVDSVRTWVSDGA